MQEFNENERDTTIQTQIVGLLSAHILKVWNGGISLSKLLYITANPKPETDSISLQLGKAFLECYKRLKPHDTIIHLDLCELDIPFLDKDVFSAWKKLSQKKTTKRN